MQYDFTSGKLRQPQEIEEERKKSSMIYRMLDSMINPKKKSANALVIHVHGGGFVAMSSGSHQSYSRMWANTLGVPIFSVDYRLAPGDQFPAALNDVWQTYYWLVLNAELVLGIKPEKIVLVGDSSGGNLIAAVTIMAIERGLRKPDGLVLCYPALSLSKLRFVPSLLLATDDPLLPYPFLKMCLDSYIGDFSQEPQCDPSLQ